MRTRPTPDRELARVAGLIGDPTRAAMLGALLGGEALPAGELARQAGVAPATATSHLARLVGMVCSRVGAPDATGISRSRAPTWPLRWRPSVESLLLVATPRQAHRRLRRSRRVVARPCLDWTERRDHLAGGAGAALASVMLERRWITRVEDTRAVRLTLRGREALFRTLELECASAPGSGK
jgi:DNA-binding transcriptional ArsR family regulator